VVSSVFNHLREGQISLPEMKNARASGRFSFGFLLLFLF
jgi:hypothetical protein